MKQKLQKLITLFSAVGLSGLLVHVSAHGIVAQNPMSQADKIAFGNQGNDLVAWAIKIIKFAIGLTGLVAVVMLIVGAVMYITSAGDETKIGKATKTMTNAIIGVLVVFIAFLIVNYVQKIAMGEVGE